MGQRGRKSGAALEVATVTAIARPDAPYDLTDEESEEWWAVVNALPADWFRRETHGLLTQYCRHVVRARRVAQLVHDAEKQKNIDVEAYDRLLKMQEREGRALSSLATRMRITQQATYDESKSKGKPAVKRPWAD